MPRKAWSDIGRDVSAYALGRTRLGSANGDAQLLLHPVDCMFMVADEEAFFGPFDEAGVPQQRLQGVKGQRYVPSRVAAYAFAHWQALVLHGGGAHDRKFRIAADWFADQPHGRFEHRFPLIGMPDPWLSALAQGVGMSVLVRAYTRYGDHAYLERARLAMSWMSLLVAQGGVLDHLPDGSPFLEEYPASEHLHVLNGCLYALVGIDELLRVEPDDDMRGLFTSVVDGVAANLAAWEDSGWSLYQYYPQAAGDVPNWNTPDYQAVHIALLNHLGTHAGNQPFMRAAERLRLGLRRPTLRARALTRKLRYRIARGW